MLALQNLNHQIKPIFVFKGYAIISRAQVAVQPLTAFACKFALPPLSFPYKQSVGTQPHLFTSSADSQRKSSIWIM